MSQSSSSFPLRYQDEISPFAVLSVSSCYIARSFFFFFFFRYFFFLLLPRVWLLSFIFFSPSSSSASLSCCVAAGRDENFLGGQVLSPLSLAFLWNSVTRGAGLLVVAAVVIVDRLARKSTERQFDCILLSISEMRQENEKKNKRIITKYKSKYLKTHNKTKKQKNRKIKKNTHRRNNRARPCWFRPPLILPTQPRHMAT